MKTQYATYHPQKRQRKRRYTYRPRFWVICFAAIGILAVSLAFVIANLLQSHWGEAGEDPVAVSTPQVISFPASGTRYVIALDAGHGGDDVGAEGLVQEVVMNERTVRFLYDLLKENPLFQPVLTRQPGESASIDQRVEAANEAGADLLLSIHGNSDTVYGSYGFECFPAPPGRTWHEGSFRLATAIAAQMQQAGARMRGEGGVRYVYYQNGSGRSADKVIHEVSDSNVYDEPSFGVVEKPDCPAVVVEQCFITHEEDFQKFGTEEGCRLAAECYYRAICEYFGV